MAHSFLSRVARYVLEKHPHNPGNHIVIVPTRRAAYFLRREFGLQAERPMVSPDILAIDDFVTAASGLHTTDPVNLLFELFEAFREVDKEVDFDRFMGWGSALLSDFDRIDMAMIAPGYLFSYLTEARALERWQNEGISGQAPRATSGTRHYFSLFENISKVYHTFRRNLEAQGRAYPGMAYRHLAENLGLLSEEYPGKERFYFAGFNAFTASEKQLVQFFTKAGRGEVLWDSDVYYMEENRLLEAGRSMREYKAAGTFGHGWRWMDETLMNAASVVNVYGVPNATLQTRVAGKLYAAMRKEGDPGLTAIVLADENLLVPMLYSLEEEVADLNITMGLPLRNSLLYTLIDGIFELQLASEHGRTARFNHRYIVKLLNHPFVRFYDQARRGEGRPPFGGLLQAIREENLVALSGEEIRDRTGPDPLIQVLFSRWPARDGGKIIRYFYKVIDLLREVYRKHRNAIETEYLYLFYTLLQQFERTIENRAEKLTPVTLRQLLFELIRKTRVPFSGEPVSDLQLIGVLETRALDFDRVIMLSVNEGVFPKKKSQNSLIPYDIARETGLPTYEHQEALSGYYFYRLLQRAREVHLLYVSTQDGAGGGEKSRFIQQLEMEWPRHNPAVKVIRHQVSLEKSTVPLPPLQLVKDETVCANIRKYLTQKGIYPTHIHLLLNSPLDFYLRHVMGMAEEKETEEQLGMDKIGTWLHNTFEALDNDYFLRRVTPSVAQIEAELTRQFEGAFSGYVTDSGLNKIYFGVGKQQFLAFMESRHLREERRRWPVATEQHMTTTFLHRDGNGLLPVKLGGKIDRVEEGADGTLYVMDYKTGSVDVKSPRTLNKDRETREAYLTTDPDYKMNYVRQLWLYQYLVYRQMENGWELGGACYTSDKHRVRSGFYSLRTPDRVVENPLELVEADDPAAYIKETERLLGIILDALLDTSVPLVRKP